MQEKPIKTSAEEAKIAFNQEMCIKAKGNLEALNSDAVIQRLDEDGNSVTLSSEEREKEKDNARQATSRFCVEDT